jgi:hypothetical protein
MAHLGGVALDRSCSPALRLHAMWILARGGRPEQAVASFRAAIAPAFEPPAASADAQEDADDADLRCRFALRHLPDVLGDAALPLLLKVMRSESNHWETALFEGLLSIGPAAVPALRAALADVECAERVHYGAITAGPGRPHPKPDVRNCQRSSLQTWSSTMVSAPAAPQAKRSP